MKFFNWVNTGATIDSGDDGRSKRVLFSILLLSLSGSILFLVIGLALSKPDITRTSFLFAALTLFCLWLFRRGHQTLPRFLMPLALLLTLNYHLIVGYGLNDVVIILYPLVLVFAALVVNMRLTLALLGIAILSLFAIVYLETQNFFSFRLPLEYLDAFTASIGLIVTTVLTKVVAEDLRRSFRQVQQSNRLLQAEITGHDQADRKLQQRAEEMYLLYQMGIALTGKQDLYHALRAMVKELKRLMITDAFHVALYNPQTDMLTYPLFLNVEEDLQIPPRKLSDNPGLSGEVIATRQTLYIPDITNPETQRAHHIVILVDVGMRSYIGIPLLLEDRVIGIMSVQARLPQAYTQEQIRLLETLAAQVVITIEKSRLLEQVQQELAERQQAEESLRASQERYRLISEVISDYTFSTQLDRQGQLQLNWVAGAFEAITGYTFEEYVANGGWLAALYPEDSAQDMKDMATLRANMPVVSEVRTYTKSGQLRWVRVYAHPVWDVERNQMAGIYGAVQDITRRKQAEEEILNSLKEKELLLKEVHHRVKNNMQVIVSMLNLQSAQVSDDRIQALLRESQNRVRSMALVHEKLYQSESLEQINFRDYAHHLVSTLFHSYSPHASTIDLKIDIGDIVLSIDAAIPCGLIINELVSNALKHAFPNHRAGEVIVGLRRLTPQTLELAVENNGVTFPQTIDFRRTESLGMQLMLSLVKQLSGEIEMQRLNPGTRFLIRFPHLAER
ncbi:MAG: GAF domain-containing protein [Chloroflexi bacterium]|nr:GAF domain-containing protein [Chloroflexota bacterium]